MRAGNSYVFKGIPYAPPPVRPCVGTAAERAEPVVEDAAIERLKGAPQI